jgi:hypothetical protein
LVLKFIKIIEDKNNIKPATAKENCLRKILLDLGTKNKTTILKNNIKKIIDSNII